MDSKDLGSRIKRLRLAAGLTQDALSDKAGLAYSTLAKIEQGAIKSPSIFTISSLASSLKVSVDVLLQEEIEAVPKTTKRSNKISFVFTDLNGVMVRYYHHAFTSLADEIQVPFDKVESIFWRLNDVANRGDMTLKQFNADMSKQLGITQKIDWQLHYMNAVEPITQMWECLDHLETAGYKLGLLSNTMPGFIRTLARLEKLPLKKFDVVIDSTVVGSVKPEKKIYHVAQKESGVDGKNIFFIDDTPANLVTAELFDWQTFLFDDYHVERSVEAIESRLLA